MDDIKNSISAILKTRDGDAFDAFIKLNHGLVDPDLLAFILNENFSENLYRKLSILSWIIFSEFSGRNFGEQQHFEISKFYISFQKYFYSWNRLACKNIPFYEWNDLAQEGISLLINLITENKLKEFKDDNRYKEFIKRFVQRHEDLRLHKNYFDLNELMD
ncbi:MAG: hypothetical protein HQK52_17160 [Oligoflexia bacterium]|nr:hypothetical protein [Oligoflexia bacterium]